MEETDATLTGLLDEAAGLRARLAHVEDKIDRRDVVDESRQLGRSRGYAVAADGGVASISKAATLLDRYGFCVVDGVIPAPVVNAIREEADAAETRVVANQDAVKSLMEAASARGVDAEAQLRGDPADLPAELRAARRRGIPAKLVNDIVWLPQHLAHPVTIGIARQVLDDHLRIAQLHLRPIAADVDGAPGGFGPARFRGRADTREWHTDWPHDLSAYGAGDPRQNAGCIRQPFPDVAMCLVMIWYLTDVDEDNAGTWVVPGSHRDPRNPRGPADGINVTSPIPGDMQVRAKAGSVFIQDSRTWHASAMHNFGGRRVAIVNRWCPWWLAVDDYAPGGVLNTVCRPITLAEYRALPHALQPFMSHLCPEVEDSLQQPVLDRARAAGLRNRWGFEQLRTNPEGVADGNAHIRVPLR